MSYRGLISMECSRDGVTRRAGQVYGGLFCPGPDPAELRAWAADDTELGSRVADDFLSASRCLPGTLDRLFFEVQLRRYPDPADAPKRVAARGGACLCQDDAHYLPIGLGNSLVHSAPPAGRPLNGLFWTARITWEKTAPAPKGSQGARRPASRRRPRAEGSAS